MGAFDVAGFACNGCRDVVFEHSTVGPQNRDIPTLGRYLHARAFLPRLKALSDDFGAEAIQFYGREPTTVSEMCQRMVAQMDMVYFHVIEGREYDEEDTEWQSARKLFLNPTGWMDGGSSYGVVFNGGGAAVVGIGTRIAGVSNILVYDVEIFGIYNQAKEKIKFTIHEFTSRGILFDVMDWMAVVDQTDDPRTTQYIGNVYTDAQFAANRYVTSWYYRNSQFIHPLEDLFVFEGNSQETGYPFVSIFPLDAENNEYLTGCGTEIQLHSSKGAIGMMVNGAQNSVFEHIYIHNVYNWADLGSDVCGEYAGPHLTTEDIDIQFGYTGTRAHGMTIDFTTGAYRNIRIENVESLHGEANGLTVYKESYVTLENVLARNVSAGTNLDEATVDGLRMPNMVPRACSVDIHELTEVRYGDADSDAQARKAEENIVFAHIVGFEVCDQFGSESENEEAWVDADVGVGDEDGAPTGYSMYVVMLVFLATTITIVVYALLLSVKCFRKALDEQREKAVVYESEYTPLVQYL